MSHRGSARSGRVVLRLRQPVEQTLSLRPDVTPVVVGRSLSTVVSGTPGLRVRSLSLRRPSGRTESGTPIKTLDCFRKSTIRQGTTPYSEIHPEDFVPPPMTRLPPVTVVEYQGPSPVGRVHSLGVTPDLTLILYKDVGQKRGEIVWNQITRQTHVPKRK